MDTDSYHGEEQHGLWFSIEIEQEEFVIFISEDALAVHFHAEKVGGPHIAYREHWRTIHEVARRKFLSGAPRPIELDVDDFAVPVLNKERLTNTGPEV